MKHITSIVVVLLFVGFTGTCFHIAVTIYETAEERGYRVNQIRVIEVDGHRFIVRDTYKGAHSMIHHPDCPKCHEPKSEEPKQ